MGHGVTVDNYAGCIARERRLRHGFHVAGVCWFAAFLRFCHAVIPYAFRTVCFCGLRGLYEYDMNL